MIHRSPIVASLLATLLVACGSTVEVEPRGDDGTGGGGGSGSGEGAGVPATTVVATSVVGTTVGPSVSSGDVSSVDSVVTSTGSGGFGEPDLYPQDLGTPEGDRNLFTIADNALGAQIFGRTPSDFGEVWLERLTAPSGSIALDQVVPSNQQAFYNFGVATMVMPQFDHPELFPQVAPGTWSIRVSQSNDANVNVIERRTIDGEFHGGVVDVNVFVVPGVSDNDYLLSQIQNGFADWAGIGLGDVRFFDIGSEFFEVNDDNYYDVMRATASAPVGQAATFVVVGYIGGSLEGAAGFSPGAPADPIGHGSNASTMVWWAQNDGFFDAIIVGHETGHFAGLSHTTEFENSFVDALADTLECPGIDFPYDFCADYNYLMFPTGGSGVNLLSPQQEKVLRASTVYRGIYQEGSPPAAPYESLLGGQQIAAPHAHAAAQSLPLDGRNAGARTPLTVGTPRALRTSLPAPVAALDGFGCGANGSMTGLLDEAALTATASELLAVARDDQAVPMFRMRALLAASRAHGASAIAGDLEAMARDATIPEQVRAGAIRALDRVAPQKRATLAPTLRGDASRLVRHLAR